MTESGVQHLINQYAKKGFINLHDEAMAKEIERRDLKMVADQAIRLFEKHEGWITGDFLSEKFTLQDLRDALESLSKRYDQ